MKGTPIKIQVASQRDFNLVVAILSERDKCCYEEKWVLNYLSQLDLGKICVWLAMQGGRCVGINAVYLRRLNSASGPISVGYWAHLYVSPSARKLMVYPRLIIEMLRWSRDAGLKLVYTGSRQQHVAAAHLRMGFRAIASLPVLIKPLRPATLLAATKAPRLWFAQVVAREIDRLYLGLRRTLSIDFREPDLKSGWFPCQEANPAFVEGFFSSGCGYVRTAWTLDGWQSRFSATIEGDCYICLALPSVHQPEAGLLMRVAERGLPPVRVGVVMDIFDKTADSRYLRTLLKLAAGAAEDAECAGVIAIEQTTSITTVIAAMRAEGYFRTPERYTIVAKAIGDEPLPSDIELASSWLFNFGEHDAF